jgi:chromosome segregation ATPase
MSVLIDEHQRTEAQERQFTHDILRALCVLETKYQLTCEPTAITGDGHASSTSDGEVALKKLEIVASLMTATDSRIHEMETLFSNLESQKVSHEEMFVDRISQLEFALAQAELVRTDLVGDLDETNTKFESLLQIQEEELSALRARIAELTGDSEQRQNQLQRMEAIQRGNQEEISQLVASTLQLETKNSALMTELDASRSKETQSQQFVSTLAFQISQLESQLSNKDCELKDLKAKYDQILEASKIASSNSQEAIEALQQNLQQALLANEKKERQYAESLSTMNSLRSEVSERELNFHEQALVWKTEKEDLVRSIAALEKTHKDLQIHSLELGKELNLLRSLLNETEILSQQSQTTILILSQENKDLRMELESVQNKYQTIRQEMSTHTIVAQQESSILKQSIIELEQRCRELEKSIATLMKTNKEQERELSIFQTQSLVLGEELASLRNLVNEKEALFQQLSANCEECQRRNTVLSEEKRDLLVECSTLKNNYQTIQRDLLTHTAAAQQESSNLKQSIIELETRHLELSQQNTSLTSEVLTLRGAVRGLEKESKRSQLTINEQLEEINTLNGTLTHLSQEREQTKQILLSKEEDLQALTRHLKTYDDKIRMIQTRSEESCRRLVQEHEEEIQDLKLFYDETIAEHEHAEQLLKKTIDKLEIKCSKVQQQQTLQKEYKILLDQYQSLKNQFDELKQHFEHRKNIDVLSNLMFHSDTPSPSSSSASVYMSSSLRMTSSRLCDILNMHGIMEESMKEILEKKWVPPLCLNIETSIPLPDSMTLLAISLHIRDRSEHWNVIPCLGDFEDYHWILDSNNTRETPPSSSSPPSLIPSVIIQEFPMVLFAVSTASNQLSPSLSTSSLGFKISSINLALEQLPPLERISSM